MKSCITCGHQPAQHYTYYKAINPVLTIKEEHCLRECHCDFFVTDNLDYIEELAKRKNLI
jgi:hypothetical protein